MTNQQGPTEGLERAREVILRLSPDRLCLGKLLDLRDALPDIVRGVVSAVIDALLGGGLVRAVSAAIEALAGRSLRQLLMKWGIVRNETVECLKNIVNTAKEASQYIDDERLRDVVEEVAKKWGWDVDTFKHFVKTAAGKTITEDEEVKKMIKEALEKIEKELREVRERVRGWLAGVEVFFINDFEDGLAYPTVKLVLGELMVLGEYGYHEVVRTGSFGALTSEVGRRLGAGSLVVLTGPKGVGKSTLATVTIWELLKSGEAGMVLRIRELPDGEVVEKFRSFIENFLVRDWKYFGNMIILYDPTGVYGQIGGVEAPSKLETTVKNILEAVMKAIENAKSILGREPSARVGVLIILPTDLYNALGNDVRGKLERYRLDASLNDAEFLAGLIREYTRTSDKPSGCALSNDVLSKLTSELAKFDSGHALIARLVGEELARNNCDVGEVEELINNTKGKAEAFIIQYINKLFKVHEDPDVAKALVEIFALRRPFVNMTRPGVPILTPGIIKLISEKREAKLLYSAVGEELRGWLAIRQHDLIEEAIGKLLDCIVGKGEECEELGDALEPWKTIGVMETLSEVSEKVRDVYGAVEYFVGHYGKEFTSALSRFSNCWKRAALIIGHALAGYSTVLRLEDLPKDITESLKDALNRCSIDDYLISNNSISLIVQRLIASDRYRRYLTNLLVNIDKYINAINEIREIHKVARARGQIYNIEALYGLGFIAVIADTTNLGESINHDDADVALDLASTVIQRTASLQSINSILSLLKPLSTKAPHRYLQLLTPAAIIEELDKDTVKHVFNEVREVLIKHYDEVKHYTWPLVNIIYIYTKLLNMHRRYFEDWEIEEMIMWVDKALHDLSNHNKELSIIAWAYVLSLLLTYNDDEIRKYMEKLRINDAINKSSEIIERLDTLVKRAGELVSDKVFRNYVESIYFKAGEEEIKRTILNAKLNLKGALARFKLSNDELDEAIRIFEELVAEYGKFGSSFEDYLVVRSWLLRSKAIKGSISNDELVKGFEELLNEALINAYLEGGGLTVLRQDVISYILSNYLVSLALENNVEKIKEVLMEYELLLNTYKSISILTKLTLNALLEQEDKLTNKFTVKPEELIETFAYDMYNEFLPALRFTYGLKPSEGDYEECKKLSNESAKTCNNAISAVMGNSDAVKQMRSEIIYKFQRLIKEKMEYLLKFGFNADDLIDNFEDLVNNFDGRFLVRLLAPRTSTGQLALMLHALTSGDRKDHNLVKAYALYGIATNHSRLLVRLFLDVYESCPDLSSEKFRRSLANLFLLHV